MPFTSYMPSRTVLDTQHLALPGRRHHRAVTCGAMPLTSSSRNSTPLVSNPARNRMSMPATSSLSAAAQRIARPGRGGNLHTEVQPRRCMRWHSVNGRATSAQKRSAADTKARRGWCNDIGANRVLGPVDAFYPACGSSTAGDPVWES